MTLSGPIFDAEVEQLMKGVERFLGSPRSRAGRSLTEMPDTCRPYKGPGRET